MKKIASLAILCKEFFTTSANNLSVTTGFIKRQRKMTGSAFIKTLILGNMCSRYCSLDGMCQLLGEDAIDITTQGLDFRFTESAVKFMKVMYDEAMRLFKNNLKLDCKILTQFKSVKLLDSSHITLPSSMENTYKGCGASYKNRGSKTKSAIKIQVVFDYLNQGLDRLDLTEGIRSDQGYRAHLADISAGELLIADLGYFVPSSFQQISDAGAYFISRYKSDTNIYDQETSQKLELLELLADRLFLEKEVFLGKEAKVKVRIICHKLTAEQAIFRRRKANLLAKSHNYTSSEKNQKLLDWSIFVTNISDGMVSGEHISSIYRARWQIELLFKLYKSHIKIEELNGKHKAPRVLCELYAKLCAALIFHGISNCLELKKEREISLTKALIELQRRSRELFLVLNKTVDHLRQFLSKLITAWSKFSLKDKYRKTRLSTLSTLKLLTVIA